MRIEEVIEKDKIKKVNEDFYLGIIRKMSRTKADIPLTIRKKHLSISIAAGIILGIISGSFYAKTQKIDRRTAMQEWLGKYNVDDIKLECIEYRIFH